MRCSLAHVQLRFLSIIRAKEGWFLSPAYDSVQRRIGRHVIRTQVWRHDLQADALGDLDVATVRLLKRIGSSRSDAEAAPLTDAFDQQRRELLPGTVVTREWNGQIHRVMVTKDGFAWDGSTFDSLSKIAGAITGTKWNGPRFFGLRDKTPTEVKP